MSRKTAPAGSPRFSLLGVVAVSKRAAVDEDGATAIEYALIAAGIGAAVAATVYSLGTSVANLYNNVAAAL